MACCSELQHDDCGPIGGEKDPLGTRCHADDLDLKDVDDASCGERWKVDADGGDDCEDDDDHEHDDQTDAIGCQATLTLILVR